VPKDAIDRLWAIGTALFFDMVKNHKIPLLRVGAILRCMGTIFDPEMKIDCAQFLNVATFVQPTTINTLVNRGQILAKIIWAFAVLVCFFPFRHLDYNSHRCS